MQLDAAGMATFSGDAVVQLWLRADASLVARDHAQAVRDRATALPVETVVSQWPARVPVQEDAALAETFVRLEAWADREGVSLEPAFRRTVHDSSFTGEQEELFVTPVCCLVIEDDDGIAGVYPHRDGRQTVSVDDGLDRLADALP